MRARVWVGFAVFVLMSGSRWLLATAFPSDLPPLVEESLHDLAIGLIAGAIAWRLDAFPFERRLSLQIAVYGILLIAVTSIVSSLKRGGASGLSGLALLTLVPAAVALVKAQTDDGFGAAEGARGMLLPALAGAGGAFLLIPVRIPASFTGKLWLVALALCVVPVAVACVRLPRLLSGVSVLSGTTVMMLACGLVEGGFSTGGGVPWSWQSGVREFAFCGLIDAPLAFLLVWLLRALEPVRLASRFQLVPILSILEGMVMVRPTLTVTTACGVLLMLGGGAFLLVYGGGESGSELTLR
jgi:hypothetical protein